VTGAAASLALGVLVGATLLSADPRVGESVAERPVERTSPPGTVPGGPAGENPGDIGPTAAPSYNPDPARPPSVPGGTVPPGADVPPRSEVPIGPVTLGTVGQIVENGRVGGDIRPDVAQDLVNMISNLEAQLESGSTDLGSATAQLRDKVVTRAAEGTLGTDSATEIHAVLDALAA
jgi:hypothetical protein